MHDEVIIQLVKGNCPDERLSDFKERIDNIKNSTRDHESLTNAYGLYETIVTTLHPSIWRYCGISKLLKMLSEDFQILLDRGIREDLVRGCKFGREITLMLSVNLHVITQYDTWRAVMMLVCNETNDTPSKFSREDMRDLQCNEREDALFFGFRRSHKSLNAAFMMVPDEGEDLDVLAKKEYGLDEITDIEFRQHHIFEKIKEIVQKWHVKLEERKPEYIALYKKLFPPALFAHR